MPNNEQVEVVDHRAEGGRLLVEKLAGAEERIAELENELAEIATSLQVESDENFARAEKAEQRLERQEEALVEWIAKQHMAAETAMKGAERAGDEKATAAYREAAYTYESVKQFVALANTKKETEGETPDG